MTRNIKTKHACCVIKQAVWEAATICPTPCKLTLKVVSESMCDMGYLCANFSLPRPLCSQLRLDVRDRQTDVRRAIAHHHLMPPAIGAGA